MSFADRITVATEALSADRRRDLVNAARDQSRRTARNGFDRVRRVAWPVAQTAAAAAIAWLIATRALGHETPYFAPVSAIMALGATRGQRARRAVEMMLGVAFGVGLADFLIRMIGTGVWQLGLIVALAMLAATVVRAGQLFVTEAAVSATLVATLAPANQQYAPTRLVDALVGGAVALVFSQLLFPVHPVKVVREAAERVLHEVAETLADVASALDAGDLDAAEDALLRARRASDYWARFESALDLGRDAARFAPRHRRRRSAVAAYGGAELPIDLIVTDLQVLARGAVRALRIGEPVPDAVVDSLTKLGTACERVSGCIVDSDRVADEASELALEATRRATVVHERGAPLSVDLLVGHIQAMAADVLRALGIERGPAHEMVGRVAIAVGEAR